MEHQSAQPAAKQAYATPQVMPFGRLADVTAAGSGTTQEDRGRGGRCGRDRTQFPCI